jgi:hypothetical protein
MYSPRNAMSMGAEQVYTAVTLVLLAGGERRVQFVARSLLDGLTPKVPISHGRPHSACGGNLFPVLDRIAARDLRSSRSLLEENGNALPSVSRWGKRPVEHHREM